MPADPKSWFPTLPWTKPSPRATPLVLKKRRTPASRPVPPPPAPPGAMDALREGDRLRKLGLSRQALAAYRAAIDTFLAEGRTAHARSACRIALEIAPEHRELLALLAELEERRTEPVPPPQRPLARIALVRAPAAPAAPAAAPAVAPAEPPAPAATPRPPTDDEKRLGLVPLALGEELMDEDVFDPATGTISMPSFTPPPAETAAHGEDEICDEMYLDLEPVLLEQTRYEERTITPPAPEPVAFFEDPEAENDRPTKVLG